MQIAVLVGVAACRGQSQHVCQVPRTARWPRRALTRPASRTSAAARIASAPPVEAPARTSAPSLSSATRTSASTVSGVTTPRRTSGSSGATAWNPAAARRSEEGRERRLLEPTRWRRERGPLPRHERRQARYGSTLDAIGTAPARRVGEEPGQSRALSHGLVLRGEQRPVVAVPVALEALLGIVLPLERAGTPRTADSRPRPGRASPSGGRSGSSCRRARSPRSIRRRKASADVVDARRRVRRRGG